MFTIYSNNIKGLQSTDKKVSLIQFVSKYRPSVILLQGTNMDTGSVKLQIIDSSRTMAPHTQVGW